MNNILNETNNTPEGSTGPHLRLETPKRRRWVWPLVATVALFAGVGIGSASDSGPTEAEYAAVQAELNGLRSANSDLESAYDEAAGQIEQVDYRESKLDQREADLDARDAKQDKRAAKLDDREAAISETEESIAANTISGDGIWTVGVDIKPGTYRASNVSADCYWGITVTGSNGDDIVNNGIPGGGNPTVSLSEGQDFESVMCDSEWVRQ